MIHPDYRAPVGHLPRIEREELVRGGAAELRERLSSLKEAQIKRARQSFPAFMEYAFYDEERQEPLRMQWFHDLWSEGFDREPRLIIAAPRDHGKTLQAVGRALWELGRDHNLRIKIACASDARAKERLFEIKQHLERNPRVREVFPKLRPDDDAEWSKHRVVVRRNARHRDASVEALGITSTITGGRADLLIADDVVDRRNALSFPALREDIKSAWRADWSNILEAHSRIWYICTLWHKCLPTGQLVNSSLGRRPVEDLCLDDTLRIGPDRWERPSAITRRWFDGELVEIRCAGQPEPVRVTELHRLPTQRGDLEAREITEADSLVLHIRPRELSMESLAKLEPAPKPTKPEPASRKNRRRHRLPRLPREQLEKDLEAGLTYGEIARKHSYSSRSHILWLVKYYGLKRRRAYHTPRPGWLTKPEFWRLAGYWLAEGDHDSSSGATRLVFGHSPDEKELVRDTAHCIEMALGVPANINVNPTAPWATRVSFSCRLVGDWLTETFGGRAVKKRIPEWIDAIPTELAREFVLGYWLGDGSVGFERGGASEARFSTSSLDLAYDLVRFLATRFGIPAQHHSNPRKRVSDAHEIRCQLSAAREMGLPVPPPRQRKSTRSLRTEDGKTLYRVKSVTWVPYRGWVYDIATSSGYFDLAGITSHNSDLSHELMANRAYRTQFYAVPADYGSLWPEKWPHEALRAKREEIGQVDFNRAFRNIAADESVAPIRPAWIKYARSGDEIPDGLVTITSYDTAVGLKKTHDFTASVTGGVDRRSGTVYILDAWHARLTVKEQAAEVRREDEKYDPVEVLLEQVGQASLSQWIAEAHPEVFPKVRLIKPKLGKYQRVVRISPLLERGDVVFAPHLNPESAIWNPGRGDLVGELLDFPIGKHDDLVDAFSQMLDRAWRLLGSRASAGEVRVRSIRKMIEDEAKPQEEHWSPW